MGYIQFTILGKGDYDINGNTEAVQVQRDEDGVPISD